MTTNSKHTETVVQCKNEETKNLKSILDSESPRDHFYIVYILFFFLGLVHILPATFFTDATEYWMYKLRNTTLNESDSSLRTSLQAEFTASLHSVQRISQVTFLSISLLVAHKFSVKVRVVASLSVIAIGLAISAVFTEINTDNWQTEFFILSLVTAGAMNSVNALLSMTLYSVMSNFSLHYLASFLTGGVLGKIVNALLQILSLASGLSVQGSALIYFSTGVILMIAVLIAFVLSSRNQFYLYNMINFVEGKEAKMIKISEARAILPKIRTSIIVVLFYFLSSNSNPMALVVSENEGSGDWSDIYFIPTITYLVAGVSELIGNFIAIKLKNYSMNGIALSCFSFTRALIFIPLFMFCNAQPRHHLPVLFPHDYQYIIILIFYSISSKYMLNVARFNLNRFVEPEELNNTYQIYLLIEEGMLAALSFINVGYVKLL